MYALGGTLRTNEGRHSILRDVTHSIEMAFLGRRLLILGKFLSNATLPGARRFSLTAPVRDPNYHPQQKGVPAAVSLSAS